MSNSEREFNLWYENNYPKIGIIHKIDTRQLYNYHVEQVNVKLTTLEYEKLEASRKKIGLSKSQYLRKLINENYED